MKKFMIVLFTVFIVPAAFACDAGYYDDNGTCKSCGDGYYCPGDDIRYQCPSAQDFCDAAVAAEPDFVSISCRVYSWKTNGHPSYTSIENCRARPTITTSCGQYYYSVTYNETSQSYPFNNPTKNWTKAYSGHYLSTQSGSSYYSYCNACTNAPANAHYTGAGTPDVGDCPWECDSGYGQTAGGQCLALCSAGITELHVGDYVFNLYATKQTSPALHVKYNDTICYVSLATGTGTNAMHIKTSDGTIYHTVN